MNNEQRELVKAIDTAKSMLSDIEEYVTDNEITALQYLRITDILESIMQKVSNAKCMFSNDDDLFDDEDEDDI